MALVGSAPYPSYNDAEAAGLAWAQGHDVATTYIKTGGERKPTMPQPQS